VANHQDCLHRSPLANPVEFLLVIPAASQLHSQLLNQLANPLLSPLGNQPVNQRAFHRQFLVCSPPTNPVRNLRDCRLLSLQNNRFHVRLHSRQNYHPHNLLGNLRSVHLVGLQVSRPDDRRHSQLVYLVRNLLAGLLESQQARQHTIQPHNPQEALVEFHHLSLQVSLQHNPPPSLLIHPLLSLQCNLHANQLASLHTNHQVIQLANQVANPHHNHLDDLLNVPRRSRLVNRLSIRRPSQALFPHANPRNNPFRNRLGNPQCDPLYTRQDNLVAFQLRSHLVNQYAGRQVSLHDSLLLIQLASRHRDLQVSHLEDLPGGQAHSRPPSQQDGHPESHRHNQLGYLQNRRRQVQVGVLLINQLHSPQWDHLVTLRGDRHHNPFLGPLSYRQANQVGDRHLDLQNT